MKLTYKERDLLDFCLWIGVVIIAAIMFTYQDAFVSRILIIPLLILIIFIAINWRKAKEMKRK